MIKSPAATTRTVLSLLSALTLLSLSSLSSASTSALSPEALAEIYSQYDVPEHDAPDCQPKAVDSLLCPNPDTKEGEEFKLPCGPLDGIEQFCRDKLGDEVVKASPGAVVGCMKYVGFHVFDHDHLACCDSDFCEDWIEAQFEQMQMQGGDGEHGGKGGDYGYDDDDHDDDDVDDDDNDVDDDFEDEY